MDNSRFRHNLKNVMEEKNISQYRAQRLTGISQSSFAKYMSGKLEPTLKNLIKISQGFGVTLERLAYGTKQN